MIVYRNKQALCKEWKELEATGYTRNMASSELLNKYRLIRETVSAIDVGRILGLDINNQGRCRCPFHNGNDRNMRVYPGNRGFYCFVCHESGDCIALAKQLLSGDCSYHDAAKWIDSTFHLNIFENKKPTIRDRMKRARFNKIRAGGISK